MATTEVQGPAQSIKTLILVETNLDACFSHQQNWPMSEFDLGHFNFKIDHIISDVY